MLYPLKFKSVYKQYLWGGRNLKQFDKNLPIGKIAEIWEVSSNEDGISIISNGRFKGLTLIDLISKMGKTIIGRDLYIHKNKEFPLLLKLIDANKKLSVQVHPDDRFAYINENKKLGKHEAWYIIDAKIGSRVIHGLKQEIDQEKFLKAINDDKIDSCLNYINVYPGDVIDINPGIIHGIGEGIVLAEIQENSNITYRIFDYNRTDINGNKRPLHLENALKVIDYNANEKIQFKGIDIAIGDNSFKSYKVANKHFSLEIYNINGIVKENADGRKFFIYLILEGEVLISYGTDSINIKKGESILIPASMGEYTLNGNFKALKTYVPDLQQDIVSPLIKSGYTVKEIYENIFTTNTKTIN